VAAWTEAMLGSVSQINSPSVYHSIFLQNVSQPVREHLFQIVQAAGVSGGPHNYRSCGFVTNRKRPKKGLWRAAAMCLMWSSGPEAHGEGWSRLILMEDCALAREQTVEY